MAKDYKFNYKLKCTVCNFYCTVNTVVFDTRQFFYIFLSFTSLRSLNATEYEIYENEIYQNNGVKEWQNVFLISTHRCETISFTNTFCTFTLLC